MTKPLTAAALGTYTTKRAWLKGMEHCLAELNRQDSGQAENLELGRKLLDSASLCQKSDPRSGLVFQKLGERIASVGDRDGALPFLLKSVECYEVSQPTSIAQGRALAWIAHCRWKSGTHEEIIPLLERSVEILEPHQLEDSECWLWAASAYVQWLAMMGRNHDVVLVMRKWLALGKRLRSQRLTTALSICSKISSNQSAVGAEAADLLNQLLQSIYSQSPNTEAEPESLEDKRANTDLLLQELEDLQSEKTQSWVRDRTEYSGILMNASPSASLIKSRVWQLWARASVFDFWYRANQVFYQLRTEGNASPSVMSSRTIWSFPKAVLKPSDYSPHGCLVFYAPSENAKYLAYGTSADGSDATTIRVRDLRKGVDLEDCLPEIMSNNISWKKDEGFYYVVCEKSADGKQTTQIGIFFHKLGQPQQQDVLVFSSKPDTWISAWTPQGWLIITELGACDDSVRFYIRKNSADDQEKPFSVLPDCFGKGAQALTFQDKCLHVVSYCEKATGKTVRYNVETGVLTDVISETNGYLLAARPSGPDHFLALTLDNCTSALSVYGKNGNYLHTVDLPPLSKANLVGYAGRQKILTSTESAVRPPTISVTGPHDGSIRLWFKSSLPFDSEEFEEELIFCDSFDGVRIPVHISKRRSTDLTKAPVILHVYGGFGRCVLPASFNSNNAVWMEMGGVIATAGTRGGSEYGRQWHDAGSKENKINVVMDILAVAEYLSGQGVASPKLGITGDSNGGLMVAAAVARTPGTFGAACIGNPVIDLLDFQRWNFGRQYISEYGNPDDENDRKAILAYSPLHVLQEASYPPTLVQLAANDDRVHNSNGLKYVAKVESLQQASHRTLLRVYGEQGHAHAVAGSSWSADRLSFLADALGLDASPLAPLVKRDRDDPDRSS